MKRLATLLFIYLALTNTVYGEVVNDGRSSISIDELRAVLQAAPPGFLEKASKEMFVRFVEGLLTDKRIEKAARLDRADEIPAIKSRMEKASRDVLVKSYIEAHVAKMAENGQPDFNALSRERYTVDKDKYKVREAIHTAHILFRAQQDDEKSIEEAKKGAEAALAELKAGLEFSEVAKKRSQDASAANGGDIGWRERGRLVGPYEKAAYALKNGEISGLVRSQFGFHIIKVIEHRPETQMSYEEAKDQILLGMRNEYAAKQREEWLKQFRGTQPVVIDDATLEALRK